jgi:peroxiredoxin
MRTTKSLIPVVAAALAIATFGGCRPGVLNSDGPSAQPTETGAMPIARPRSSPLKVSDTAPEFEARDQQDRSVTSVELTSGKGSAILFVPPDGSAAARPSFQWARRQHLLLQQRGIELLLVVPESPAQAAAIAAREDLRLALLSDPAGHIARAFGTVPKGARSPARSHLFFVGGDGRIHYSESGTGDAAQLILAAESLPGARRQSAVPIF